MTVSVIARIPQGDEAIPWAQERISPEVVTMIDNQATTQLSIRARDATLWRPSSSFLRGLRGGYVTALGADHNFTEAHE